MFSWASALLSDDASAFFSVASASVSFKVLAISSSTYLLSASFSYSFTILVTSLSFKSASDLLWLAESNLWEIFLFSSAVSALAFNFSTSKSCLADFSTEALHSFSPRTASLRFW